MLKRAPVLALWGVTGLLLTLLAARFGMRAVGVRDDIPFPTLIYAWTAPLVEPFYTLFPASDRFDYPAVEVASLVAMGAVLALALALYTLALLASKLAARPARKPRSGA
jgi:uncharacterized protein YggT (Ycf19 family)